MRRKTVWLILLCIAVVAFNAYWNLGNKGSTTIDGAAETSPKGNFDIAFAALEAEEFEFAFNEFTVLAREGSSEAQLVIATMYKRGEGVAQNYNEAMSWYYAAAKQNNGVAQAALGAMYVDGKGAPADLREAYKWYYLAEKNKAPFSSETLSWIESQLTELEVSEAKKLSDLCMSSSFEDCALKH